MTNNAASPAMKNGKPRFFYGYVIAVATFFVMLVVAGVLYSFGVFFKPVSAEFGWERAVTSGAYSVSLFVMGLASLITGRLNDRFGPRMVLTVCGLFLGAGYLLMSRISSVWQLYVVFGAIVAIGNSGTIIPVMSTIARWFVRRRGLMTGIVMAGVGVGQIAVPLAATQMISAYDWRITFVIIGAIALVIMVSLAQFLRRDPGQMGQTPDGGDRTKLDVSIPQVKGFSRQEAMHTGQFWVLCAIYFCYEFILQGTMVHLVPYATDIGISPVSAASIVSVVGGAGIVGRIGMGSIGDRIGNKRALTIAFIVAIAAFVWLQFSGELSFLYLFAVLFGFAYGGLISMESPTVASIFGMKAHGAILGMVHFAATIGGAISPLLAGRIFDVTGSYQAAFLIILGISVTGLILSLLIRPPHKAESGSIISGKV